jgi:hypothetical protein
LSSACLIGNVQSETIDQFDRLYRGHVKHKMAKSGPQSRTAMYQFDEFRLSGLVHWLIGLSPLWCLDMPKCPPPEPFGPSMLFRLLVTYINYIGIELQIATNQRICICTEPFDKLVAVKFDLFPVSSVIAVSSLKPISFCPG